MESCWGSDELEALKTDRSYSSSPHWVGIQAEGSRNRSTGETGAQKPIHYAQWAASAAWMDEERGWLPALLFNRAFKCKHNSTFWANFRLLSSGAGVSFALPLAPPPDPQI